MQYKTESFSDDVLSHAHCLTLMQAGIISMTYPNLSNPWPLIATSLSPYEIYSAFKNTGHAALANKYLSDPRMW